MQYNIALLFKVLCASQKILDSSPHQYPICDQRRCTLHASEVPLYSLFYIEMGNTVTVCEFLCHIYEFKI